ncbi:MAG TPA: hypothetical protein VMQ65_10685 [Candidatus Limnocylindria bacterium]|nr:hypothetical protein [Candidatus Limnocylindria bacterium]
MFRAFLSILFALILVGVLAGVLAGVGTQVYQAGVAQGIVEAGRFPAGATVPVVGGYQGFDFLGLLFPLLLLFLLFGIIRAAFSHGRGWDHHGYRHGGGWDRGWDRDETREGGPGSWREQRERRTAELHRRLHESEGTDVGSGAGGTTITISLPLA